MSTTPSLPLNTVGTKYATALLSFITVLATPLTAMLAAPVTTIAIWQFVAVAAGAVGAFIVPLAPTTWQGFFKTGVAILGAVAAAVIPIVAQEWTAQSTLIVVMAVVNILATELGVVIRTDTKVAPQNAAGVFDVSSMIPSGVSANYIGRHEAGENAVAPLSDASVNNSGDQS